LLAILFFTTAGCAGCLPGGEGGGPDAGGTGDGGTDPGHPSFDIITVDSTPGTPRHLDLALASDGTIGVAYFNGSANAPDGGVINVDVMHARVNGTTVSTPVKVDTVNLDYGLSTTFNGSGKALVSYLGGGNDASLSWHQSDMALGVEGAGTFTTDIVATLSNSSVTGDNVADFGVVVGLWSAIAWDGSKVWLAWRDVHGGQFPTDWGSADIETGVGGPGAWTYAAAEIGHQKNGYGPGNFMRMVIGANNEPAILHTANSDSAGSENQASHDIHVTVHASNAWTTSKIATVLQVGKGGAAFAYDSQVGYATAWYDVAENTIKYSDSPDAVTFNTPDPVAGGQSAGNWIAIAFDSLHEPRLIYYVCARKAGASVCVPAEDELKIATRIGGDWVFSTVDPAGGYFTKAIADQNGKLVVGYRDPTTGAMKIAREK
jgi:hypothetical protein